MSAKLYLGESGSIVCYAHAGSTLQASIDNTPDYALKFLGMNYEVFDVLDDSLMNYLRAHDGMNEFKCEVCK